VQDSALAKSLSGSSVNVVGPPLAVAVCDPLVEHEIEYQAPVTSTASLNVIEMFALTATSLAPFDGVVLVTLGGSSRQLPNGEAVLRGFGPPTVKSAALLFVSSQPFLFLFAAVVLLSVPVGPLPSKQVAEDP
jgi:hypothetical protein